MTTTTMMTELEAAHARCSELGFLLMRHEGGGYLLVMENTQDENGEWFVDGGCTLQSAVRIAEKMALKLKENGR